MSKELTEEQQEFWDALKKDYSKEYVYIEWKKFVEDITKVQPMTNPCGEIFALKAKYDE